LAIATAALSVPPEAQAGVRRFRYMVPMRDGVELATDVYLPRRSCGPLPAILIRTPYGKHEIGKLKAGVVCRRGYALVVQDVRGRFQSGGEDALVFRAGKATRIRDGHDTVNWIAGSCWCNGNVGTFGPSAMGVAANLLAADAPDALKAQHVMMAFSDMYSQAAYQGGVFRKALAEGWLEQSDLSGESLKAAREHPHYNGFWSELNCEARAGRVNTPGVFWGGWYDPFSQGAINSFTTINSQGGPRARGNCRLIMGPWRHDDIRRLLRPRVLYSQPAAGNPFRFFQHYLQGVSNGVPSDKPVHYYVMGDCEDPCAPGNVWRSADAWPPPADETTFFFHADGALTTQPPASVDGKRTYKYDPTKPVRTIGGQNLNLFSGPADQRAVESRRDVLLFTSDVLKVPIEVTGRLRAELFISSDCPDTDFTVKLTDVYPDGRSMLVADGILRARYRESFTAAKLLEPGRTYRISVDLWSTSYAFNRGHKIRIAVSSSNAPRFEPNPNTGKPADSDAKTRTAVNTIHLSKSYPSHILLPVYAGASD